MATNKLFVVEVEKHFNVVVFARDVEDALVIAKENAEEEDRNGCNDFDVSGLASPITAVQHIPRDWRGSIPYGEDVHDRSVDEILRDLQPVAK